MEIDNWITQVVSREDKAQTSGTKKDVVFLFGIDFLHGKMAARWKHLMKLN